MKKEKKYRISIINVNEVTDALETEINKNIEHAESMSYNFQDIKIIETSNGLVVLLTYWFYN
ncbi:MAG: hypothetical protein HOC36_02885 [Candidatus Magasanikbacteria bacterium]|jgi:hypothetical protein|nr:hypothetical protein [Candidatus Magasanikbacteria bacterium]MBT4547267.1 hypothetical protein [Candidatus Magasanikbacteria bacterium]